MSFIKPSLNERTTLRSEIGIDKFTSIGFAVFLVRIVGTIWEVVAPPVRRDTGTVRTFELIFSAF